MISRPSRRWIAGLGTAVIVLIPVTMLLRLHDAAAPAVVAASSSSDRPGLVSDAIHAPWYRLRTLADPIQFQGPARPAGSSPVVSATAGILVDIDTGRILWARNPHLPLQPASTIKMITALVALENFSPARLVTVTQSALFQAPDESVMYLKAGQHLSVAELLTAMLMISANDAADALAVDTVGMERFVGAMNGQVGALGLHDTHVTSPVGLSEPGQYSTAYDLAVVAAADVENLPLFRSIVSTRYTELPATATHTAFAFTNLNQLLAMYPYAIGIKTGYTGDAGACEVGMAVRDGHRLISVILNGDLVYSTSRRLLDWGFVQEGLTTTLPTPTPAPPPSPHPAH
jgi:D-alanyl-D-alanine carboxypeptidase (penicillin-binding protein 5/6)